jgi:hypothetical protein
LLKNYLLDVDIIADLLMDREVVKMPFNRRAEATGLIDSLWEGQLNDFAMSEVYSAYGYEDVALRKSEVAGLDFHDAAKLLFARIDNVRTQLGSLDRSSWPSEFEEKSVARRSELEIVWRRDWMRVCDGKRLLADLHRSFPLRMGLLQFKKRIIYRMSAQQSSSWTTLGQTLRKFLELT